jgi:hypothetical protein
MTYQQWLSARAAAIAAWEASNPEPVFEAFALVSGGKGDGDPFGFTGSWGFLPSAVDYRVEYLDGSLNVLNYDLTGGATSITNGGAGHFGNGGAYIRVWGIDENGGETLWDNGDWTFEWWN